MITEQLALLIVTLFEVELNTGALTVWEMLAEPITCKACPGDVY